MSLPRLKDEGGFRKVATIVSLAWQSFSEAWSQYVPLVVTLIEEVLAPVLHRKAVLVDVSFNTSVAPVQRVVSLPKCTAGGKFLVRIMVSLMIPQWLESSPQYKPAADTVMLDVVSPLLHL